jgi:hypothetical protein
VTTLRIRATGRSGPTLAAGAAGMVCAAGIVALAVQFWPPTPRGHAEPRASAPAPVASVAPAALAPAGASAGTAAGTPSDVVPSASPAVSSAASAGRARTFAGPKQHALGAAVASPKAAPATPGAPGNSRRAQFGERE